MSQTSAQDLADFGYSLQAQQFYDHPLFLRVQALEREAAGLRAKVTALTNTANYPFSTSRSSTVSREVIQVAEAEIGRLREQYNEALARKNAYKRRLLSMITRIASAKDALRIVLDVARMHQNAILFQAIRVVEDVMFSSWLDLDISDSGPDHLPLTTTFSCPLNLNPHQSSSTLSSNTTTSIHTSASTCDLHQQCILHAKHTSPRRLPPISKKGIHHKEQAVQSKQSETTTLEKLRVQTNTGLIEKPLELKPKHVQPYSPNSTHTSPSHESSYLANSSLWIALERRMATEVVQVVQEAYEMQNRDTSTLSIDPIKTPGVLSHSSFEVLETQLKGATSDQLSETIVRQATPKLSILSASSACRIETPSHVTCSQTITPEDDQASNVTLDSLPPALLMLQSSLDLVPIGSLPRLISPDPDNSGKSILESTFNASKNLPEDESNVSQTVSVTSFLCGMIEMNNDSNESNAEDPVMTFSPRAEELMSQASSLAISNHALNTVSTSQAKPLDDAASLKMLNSRFSVATKVTGSVESDMLVSDINVMQQTNTQQQMAKTRFLESKEANDESTEGSTHQETESTESMGLIVDRSRATVAPCSVGASAYLIDTMMIRSGDMSITPDMADFCLSRPITADQADMPLVPQEPTLPSPAVLTIGMLERTKV